MTIRKPGAPKGGRVHWLLWCLPTAFKGEYRVRFDYATHNYLFYRTTPRKLEDVFIVRRTSRNVWRVMYASVNADIRYFSARNARSVASWIVAIWKGNSANLS